MKTIADSSRDGGGKRKKSRMTRDDATRRDHDACSLLLLLSLFLRLLLRFSSASAVLRHSKKTVMATILSPPQTKASTPMRALTSSLAARASPPVPPAAETYEPLLKAELRRRLTQLIFPCSAIALLMLSNHGTSWNASIIGLTALQWLGGILPLIVMRKANITGVLHQHHLSYH